MGKITIIYWSGTGNTQAMAEAIGKGAEDAGSQVELLEVSSATAQTVAQAETLAFGCPSMGAEVLEEDSFDPFFTSVESSLSGKKVALFGSYGWGDGQWMRDWQERVTAAGATLFEEGLIVQEAPEGPECEAFGKRLAAF